MAFITEKSHPIQKPFRCPEELNLRINRTKGALMQRTGASISDNQFFLELVELGLEVMSKRIDKGHYDPKK